MNGMKSFEPNDATDQDFGDALREASSCGVSVLAYDCTVEPDSLQINSQIKVEKIENIC